MKQCKNCLKYFLLLIPINLLCLYCSKEPYRINIVPNKEIK